MTETTIRQDEAQRAHLHGMWSAVAPGWSAHAGFIDDRGAPVTEAMLFVAAPEPGERVLELGCGPGGPGFEAARLVGPRGEVVVSDVSAEMTAIAAARAQERGLGTVSCRVLDLEEIDVADASFDVVLSREALMLVADPVRAATEIRRVLAPGGRVVLTVWGERERNPWLGLVFDVVSAQLGMPIPPPGVPHPFSLDDRDRLAAVLTEAGLSDACVVELPTPYRAASADEWWERTAALAGPLSAMLAALPDAAAHELKQRAVTAIAPYATESGLEIPGVSLLATASVEEATG